MNFGDPSHNIAEKIFFGKDQIWFDFRQLTDYLIKSPVLVTCQSVNDTMYTLQHCSEHVQFISGTSECIVYLKIGVCDQNMCFRPNPCKTLNTRGQQSFNLNTSEVIVNRAEVSDPK